MDPYVGQLVVLRSLWNLQSYRIGVVVEQVEEKSDRFIVMWTTTKGIELKMHIKDALMIVSKHTSNKVKERACVFK
jgi:predicted nucleic acid-binding OB-fold protein